MKCVVIGAGFSGLAAAARLLLEGHQVTVLEQKTQVGGKAEGWQGIPTGPTVITMPEVMRELFNRLHAVPPTFKEMNPTSTYHFADGRIFKPYRNMERTFQELNYSEADSYRDLLMVARDMYNGARNTFLYGPPPTPPALMQYALKHGLKARPGLTLEQLLEPTSKYLKTFFLRFATYAGANPYKAPAILHNIAWVELGLGVWHVQGGFAAVAQSLEKTLKQRGVEFVYGTKVLGLETTGSRITRVQTDKGDFQPDWVVSSMDRNFTLKSLGKDIPQEELTISGFTLQAHLFEDRGLGHQILFPQNYRQEWADIEAERLPRDPTIYVHTDGKKAFIMVNSPPLETPNKEAYAEQILKILQQRYPLSIREYNVMAPQDYARTAYSGALYGRAPHGLKGALRYGWTIEGIKNLRQVGGTVHPGGGVPLSILSGYSGALPEFRSLVKKTRDEG
ncbi:phytoene desaturase family protein [Deinococcus roseus]|uniref:Methoxyneurosporene dehydrogenase n=1 Tax=Deinococcus roseus TaxID=392414 RepID=A0ABQ2D504_9DEIO|nr:FAD-dependent oxidoreductase [Deinococcus roseus]GGJ46391.1 methoxyneurosporene dehydrogenase [Deinococcus roseus]